VLLIIVEVAGLAQPREGDRIRRPGSVAQASSA
jgi:hypothetical protein